MNKYFGYQVVDPNILNSATHLAMPTRPPSPYPSTIPKVVPEGDALVHNYVRAARRNGTRGFRFWLQPITDGIEICDCKWAPELPEHYRSVTKS
jgi:hypothetical protein